MDTSKKRRIAAGAIGVIILLGIFFTPKLMEFIKYKQIQGVFEEYQEQFLEHILFDDREKIPADMMDDVLDAIEHGKKVNGMVRK